MNPVIGIVPSIEETKKQYFTNITNVRAIQRVGGLPFILPYTKSKELIKKYATFIDGLYLAGGNDLDPCYYKEDPHPMLGEVNPTRDEFEWEMLKNISKADKPVLGVCKGAQVINVFFGGSLYQDLSSQLTQSSIQHGQKALLKYPVHVVELVNNTKLHDIIRKATIKVNSHHHQAIREVGDGITVSGQTNDGIIESIESTRHSFIIGVQWHPEELFEADEELAVKLYKEFINQCKRTTMR